MSSDITPEIENLVYLAMRRYEPNETQWRYLAIGIGNLDTPHARMIQITELNPAFRGLPKDKAALVFYDIADYRILIIDSRESYRTALQMRSALTTEFPPVQYLEVEEGS